MWKVVRLDRSFHILVLAFGPPQEEEEEEVMGFSDSLFPPPPATSVPTSRLLISWLAINI